MWEHRNIARVDAIRCSGDDDYSGLYLHILPGEEYRESCNHVDYVARKLAVERLREYLEVWPTEEDAYTAKKAVYFFVAQTLVKSKINMRMLEARHNCQSKWLSLCKRVLNNTIRHDGAVSVEEMKEWKSCCEIRLERLKFILDMLIFGQDKGIVVADLDKHRLICHHWPFW